MQKSKKIYLFIFSICSFLGFIVKIGLRKFLSNDSLKNNLIVDNSPSFLFVIGISFLALFIVKRESIKPIIAIAIGALIYEIEQYFFKSGTFDTCDIIAIFLGMLISITIYNLIKNRLKNIIL